MAGRGIYGNAPRFSSPRRRDCADGDTRAAELVLAAQAAPWAPYPGWVRRGRRGPARDLRVVCKRAQDTPIWPVFIAGAGFLYLWWLGILVFDLAFMWHRYIRHSVAVENLWFWKEELDTPSSRKACEDTKQKVKADIKKSARAACGGPRVGRPR